MRTTSRSCRPKLLALTSYQHCDKRQRPASEERPTKPSSRFRQNLSNFSETLLDEPRNCRVGSTPEYCWCTPEPTHWQGFDALLAGVDIWRVINEPTAAALAYGLHKNDSVSDVVVVDLGGGTLDVSLLHIQGGMFLTQAMSGWFKVSVARYSLEIIEANSMTAAVALVPTSCLNVSYILQGTTTWADKTSVCVSSITCCSRLNPSTVTSLPPKICRFCATLSRKRSST